MWSTLRFPEIVVTHNESRSFSCISGKPCPFWACGAESRGSQLRGDVKPCYAARSGAVARVWAEGSILNGIPGQDVAVRGLWGRIRFYRRGAVVFPRQAVQERTQTLQILQS